MGQRGQYSERMMGHSESGSHQRPGFLDMTAHLW